MGLASRLALVAVLVGPACAQSDAAEIDAGPAEVGSTPPSPAAPTDEPRDPSDPPARDCQRAEVVVLDGGATVVIDLPCQPFDPKLQAPDPPF